MVGDAVLPAEGSSGGAGRVECRSLTNVLRDCFRERDVFALCGWRRAPCGQDSPEIGSALVDVFR